MMKQFAVNNRTLVKPSCRPVARLVVRASAVESKGAAAPAPTATGPEVQVTFQLAKHVEFGQSICITGNVEPLGSWNATNSISLDWTDGDVWTAACQLPAGSAFEYKYIIRSGERVVWQPCENLTAVVPEDISAVQYIDDWAGKSRSIDCGDGPTANEATPAPAVAVAAAADIDTTATADKVADDEAAAVVEPLLSTSSTDIAAESLLEHAMEQELAKTSIESLPVDKLKDLLLQRGLPAKGRKEQMVQRLKAAQDMAGPMPNNGRTKSAA